MPSRSSQMDIVKTIITASSLMRQKNKGEGTKIAQAAKELGVTSVTIRRYITEFNIETTADENGIKVLPKQAMDELSLIRKHKEDGLTNPKVLEILEETRSKGGSSEKSKPAAKEKEKEKEKPEPTRKAMRKAPAEPAPAAKSKKAVSKKVVAEEEEEEEEADEDAEEESAEESDDDDDESDDEDDDIEAKKADSGNKDDGPIAIPTADGKSKYSLTCQTCQKTFEHMNPRLRDCLDCYRIKRKERRRGGDKHKNVIQNPIAQQVISKNQQAQAAAQQMQGPGAQEMEPVAPIAVARTPIEQPRKISVRDQLNFAPVGTTPPVYQRTQVRSYRKAIEETRQITSNLKRRLERPDLPEAERRFLEQIYAYQLILHQGWKHLSEYKQGDSPRHD